TPWRGLIPFRVDLSLRVERKSLIGRHRVNREEPGRVARQAIDRDHPDPVVDFVESAVCSTLEEVRTQRADLAQRLGVIEDEEAVLGVRRVQATQIQSPKSSHYRA